MNDDAVVLTEDLRPSIDRTARALICEGHAKGYNCGHAWTDGLQPPKYANFV